MPIYTYFFNNYIEKGMVKSCFVLSFKLKKTGEYFVKNISNEKEIESFDDAIFQIKNFTELISFSIKNKVNVDVLEWILQKILKNLVLQQRYYAINYINLLMDKKLKMEDSDILPKQKNVCIFDVIKNVNLKDLKIVLKEKKIDPCYYLYLLYKTRQYIFYQKLKAGNIGLIS